MTDLHPIVPPLSLINQWWDEVKQNAKYDEPIGPLVATKAAQWGADQELDACVQLMPSDSMEKYLRTARRPKLPSVMDLALDALGPEPLPENAPSGYAILNGVSIERHRRIRRALERLKKLEESTND